MAATTNIHGFNIGGNNNSFDQRGHFYRAFLDGNVSGMLVKQNSTPNMTVLVEHGSALLNKNTISASIAEIKSDTSVAIDTANTSNPRIDAIVIYEDTSVTIPTVEANYWQDGAGGRFKIVSLPGTAAASPTALTDANIQSAIGAGKPFARLANITVPANSTTIINSNIADKRSQLGGTIPDKSVTSSKIDFANLGVASPDTNGDWATWTPTWTNFTIGNGTATYLYTQVGKTINWRINVVLGSTSSMGTVATFTLPVTASSSGYISGDTLVSFGSARDNGGSLYPLNAVFISTTTFGLRYINTSAGNFSGTTATAPLTWSNGDSFSLSGFYQAA